MRSLTLIAGLLLSVACGLTACGQTSTNVEEPVEDTYSTETAGLQALLQEGMPAPLEAKWSHQVQDDFYNEGKLVAVLTLSDEATLRLKEKLNPERDEGGEYLPGILREWFPPAVRENFYEIEGTGGMLASRVPQYRASDILASPYAHGQAFIIDNYLLVIGQSM
ncbi:MAG: hypothetical protein WBB45_13330 [Cyclobacteriaceae bacterium]